jgi:hypothetical protein
LAQRTGSQRTILGLGCQGVNLVGLAEKSEQPGGIGQGGVCNFLAGTIG